MKLSAIFVSDFADEAYTSVMEAASRIAGEGQNLFKDAEEKLKDWLFEFKHIPDSSAFAAIKEQLASFILSADTTPSELNDGVSAIKLALHKKLYSGVKPPGLGKIPIKKPGKWFGSSIVMEYSRIADDFHNKAEEEINKWIDATVAERKVPVAAALPPKEKQTSSAIIPTQSIQLGVKPYTKPKMPVDVKPYTKPDRSVLPKKAAMFAVPTAVPPVAAPDIVHGEKPAIKRSLQPEPLPQRRPIINIPAKADYGFGDNLVSGPPSPANSVRSSASQMSDQGTQSLPFHNLKPTLGVTTNPTFTFDPFAGRKPKVLSRGPVESIAIQPTTDWQKKAGSYQNQANNFQSQLVAAQKAARQQATDYQRKLDSIQQLADKYKTSWSGEQQNAQSLGSKLSELQKNFENAKRAIGTYKQEFPVLQDRLASAQKQNTGLAKQLAETQDTLQHTNVLRDRFIGRSGIGKLSNEGVADQDVTVEAPPKTEVALQTEPLHLSQEEFLRQSKNFNNNLLAKYQRLRRVGPKQK